MKRGFKENLQKQLAENLNINMSNIQDLKSLEGGVEVMSPTNLMSLTVLMSLNNLISSTNLMSLSNLMSSTNLMMEDKERPSNGSLTL